MKLNIDVIGYHYGRNTFILVSICLKLLSYEIPCFEGRDKSRQTQKHGIVPFKLTGMSLLFNISR